MGGQIKVTNGVYLSMYSEVYILRSFHCSLVFEMKVESLGNTLLSQFGDPKHSQMEMKTIDKIEIGNR